MTAPDSEGDELADELAAYDEALREKRLPVEQGSAADLRDLLQRLDRRFPRQSPTETQEFREEQELAVDAPVTDNHQIGRFQILRELGRGGFGVVFQAYDPKLERHVALKVPRTDLFMTGQMRDRFLHEAKAAAGLDHPQIVPIYEVNEAGPLCYIALAYCDGPDLAQWFAARKEPLPIRQAAAIIAAIADGVQHAHERGILHRDLKPANILLVPISGESVCEDDQLPFSPRVTDFGMAKLLDASLTETRSSVVMGTPLYMAPEQAEGRSDRIGPGVDVYALGAILYELLAGRTPFESATLVGLLDELRSSNVPDSPGKFRESIPAELETICLKCLRRDSNDRYATAKELSNDLRRFLNDEPVRARRTTWFDQLRWWTRSPQRILDAGVVAVGLNAAIACTAPANLIPVFLGFDVPLVIDSVAIKQMVQLSTIHVLLAWNGLRILKHRRLSFWIGALGSVAPWSYCSAIIFFGAPALTIYKSNPVALWVQHWLLWLLFTSQLAVFLLAFPAQMRSSKS